MKILLITNGYPPRDLAGTEIYTAGIAEELQRRKHKVEALCAGEWETGDQYWNGYSDEAYRGVTVRRLNLNWKRSPNPFGYFYNNPVVAEYLQRYLAHSLPDIVHVTSCLTLSASILQVVKQAGLPLVLSLTDFWFLCPRINLLRSDGVNCDGLTTAWECLRCQLLKSKAYRWPSRILPDKYVSSLLTGVSRYPLLSRQRGLRGVTGNMADRKAFLRQAISWPDCRITASRFVRDLFAANGIKDPIKVKPYGHDLSWLTRYRGKTRSSTVRIGFIGHLTKAKGVHLLLRAIKSLQPSLGGRFSVSIYGRLLTNTTFAAQLQELAKGIPNVRFCGVYQHDQSADVFAGIDVLVVPSVWYDFPLIIYEAFACKTPVITSNLAGMAEAVTHEVNGLLFKRGDAFDLAGRLARVICEKDLLERLSVGIPKVRTIQEDVSELESIYADLIDQRGSFRNEQSAEFICERRVEEL